MVVEVRRLLRPGRGAAARSPPHSRSARLSIRRSAPAIAGAVGTQGQRDHRVIVRSLAPWQPYARGMDRQATLIELLVAALVGIGDGIVGRVPAVDKYPSVHTIYRLTAFGVGAAGALTEKLPDQVSSPMMIASTALLASRIPAAVTGGGWRHFG